MHVGFLLLLCAFKLGECQHQPLQSPFGTPISDWLFVIRTSPGWLSRKWPYCGFSTTSPQPETIISCDKGSPPLFSLFTLVSPSGQLPALTGQKLLLVSHTTGLCGTPVDSDQVAAADSRSSGATAAAVGGFSRASRGQHGPGQAERQRVTQQQDQIHQQQQAGGRQRVQQQAQQLQLEQTQQHEEQQQQQQHQKPGQEGQQHQQQDYHEAESDTWPVLSQRHRAAVNRSAVSCRTSQEEAAPSEFQLLPQDLTAGVPIDLDAGVVYYLLEGDKFCGVVDTDQAKASLVCDLNTTSGAMRFALLPAAMPSAALTSLASSNRCGIKSLLLPPPHDFMCLAGRASKETDSTNPTALITSTALRLRNEHSGEVVRNSLRTWDVLGGSARLKEAIQIRAARGTLSRQQARWWGWSGPTDTAAAAAGAQAAPGARTPLTGQPRGLAGALQPWKRIPEQDMKAIYPLELDSGFKPPPAHSLSAVFANLTNRAQSLLWTLCTWVWGLDRCRDIAVRWDGKAGSPIGHAADSERDYTFTLLLQKPGSGLGSGSVVAMVTYSPGLVGFPLQQCCPELDSPHVVDCGVAGGDPLPSECWFTLYKINGKSGEPIRDGDLVTIQSKSFSRYCSITSDGTLLCVSASSSNASRNLFRYQQVLNPGHV